MFLDYTRVCRDAGIDCPILPGIMPIQGYSSFKKMTQFCRTRVPDKIWADLSLFRENDEEVKAYGVSLCINMCKTLLKAGVPGFHFYTLNLEKSVGLILDGISAKKDLASDALYRGEAPALAYETSDMMLAVATAAII